MARGDKRKRNIKRDWTTLKDGNTKTSSQPKTYKKDTGLPNLKGLGKKLEKKLKPVAEGGVVNIKAVISIEELAQKSASRSHVYNETVIAQQEDSFQGAYNGDAAAMGRKDNSLKAYYREFKKVVQQADVILEILDARDPLGCRTREVEEMIMNAGSEKRIVLILNKIDLVPRETVEAWLKYLRNEFPTVAFKASTQTQRTNLGQSSVKTGFATEALLGSSESLGSDALVKLLKNYCRNLNIKTSITVGVVGTLLLTQGFPNVGKSSVINSLKRAKVCGVGATPGVTKVAQAIHLDKNIKLLDCPGIVFSKSQDDTDSAQVLLRNCVKVELLSDPISPVEVILSRCSHEQLAALYELKPFGDTREFLISLAQQRGKLLKGGVPDIDNAARSVIQDWNQGRIPFYTLPPKQKPTANVSSSLVAGWGAEFSIADLDDTDTLAGNITSNDNMIAIDSIDTPLIDMEMKVEEPEGVEVEEEEEYMDTDEPLVHLPTFTEIRFKPLPKKTVGVEKKQIIFTPEEQENNPQQVSSKKLAKKGKKDARRLARLDLDSNSDSDASM